MTQEDKIRERIAQHLGTSVAQIDWGAGLDASGLGSLQFVEVFVDLQETFNVPLFHDDIERIECLGDLVKVLDGRIQYGSSFGRSGGDAPEGRAGAAGA